MSSANFLIANPIYDLTFNALFGPNSEVVDGIGGKERLVSFLNQIYPQNKITYVEYIEIQEKSPYYESFQFDIMCKCYDSLGFNPYDVSIQRRTNKDSFDDSYLSSAQFLRYKAKYIPGMYEMPQIRILSILNFLLDSSQPAIFCTQIVSSTTTKSVNNDILWTHIQLPKLVEEGTNNQWLQLLIKGLDFQPFFKFENSNPCSDSFKSGISLLNSYTSGPKGEQVTEEAHQIFTQQVLIATLQKQYKDEIEIKIQNKENRMFINSIIHFIIDKKFSSEKISNILDVPIEFVNFIFDIYELSKNYFNYCTEKGCDPNYSDFFGEVLKQFEISDTLSQPVN